MSPITRTANWWRENRSVILASFAALIILLFTIGGAVGAANAITGSSPQSNQETESPYGDLDPGQPGELPEHPDFATDTPVENGSFVIATDTTFAPFVFQEGGENVGIDMDLLRAIAANQGFEVEVQTLGFDAALQAVQGGQADGVIAGMGITEERAQVFDFSDPYYESGIQMAVAENSDIASYDDLAGQTVAVKTGTTSFEYATELSQEIGFTINSFQDSADMYNDVATGNSAATFEDSPVLQYGISTGNVPLKIVTEPEPGTDYGFAVSVGENAELLEMFNAGLAAAQETGVYDMILDRYLSIEDEQEPKPYGDLPVGDPGTLPEHPDFATDTPVENGSYVIATDTTFAPFVFQQGGENVGIDMDLLRAIAANQGFEVEIQTLGFDAALQAVQGGQAEGVIAGMGINEERAQVFDFSDPYYESGIQMAVAEDSDITSYEDLAGETVAVKTGTTSFDYATELGDEIGFTINSFQDSADMYNDVATGNSAATFEDSPVLLYGISTGNVPLKVVTEPEPGTDYGFAVAIGENPELLAMFNEGLQNARDTGVYDMIIDRYLAVEDEEDSGTSFFGLAADAFPALMQGLGYTLIATALSIVFAMILGILFGLLKLSKNWFLRGLAGVYVNIFRGTPVLVQAFFFYFGVPALTGEPIDALTAGVITLSLNAGAYITEIVRGGVQSVDPGQMEASRSLGLGWGPSMRKVVMPQAFKIMTPSLINQFIMTLKDTSLLSVIGFAELTYQGRIVIASTFRSFEIWLIVGAVYFIVIWLLTLLSNWIDRKFNK